MFIAKKAIPRRTVLRGIGATLALPLLDSMVPALSALARTSARPVNRFGVVYVPNGMIMKNYLPVLEGAAYELTPTLSALAPFREQMLVVSGLECIPTPGRPGGAHAKASTRFLTDVSPPTSETWLDAGVSMDQIVAQEIGRMQGALPRTDRVKLTEYFDAIRDVEQRIQIAEAQSDEQLPLVDHPAGIPASWEDHVMLMFDLQVLAYRCDLTRVITLMLGH